MSHQPAYYAYNVRDREKGKKSIWTRIGTVWSHDKGAGLNLEIEALPLNFTGKLVLMPPKKRDAAQPAAFDADEEIPFDV